MTLSPGSQTIPGGETLRAFAAAARGGVVVVDESGTILLSNPVAESLLHRSHDELVGAEFGFPLVPGGTSEIEVVADGGVRTLEIQVTVTSWGSRRAFVVALEDAATRKRFARRLTDSEARFRAVFEETPVGLAVLDEDLRILQVNRALCRIFGYHREELEQQTLRHLVGEPSGTVDERLATELESGSAVDVELSFVTRQGEPRQARFVVSAMSGSTDRPRQAIASVEDVTDRNLATARIARLALRDDLTGLANRSVAMDRLQLAQARAQRNGTFVGLLFLDLDGFKAVNDSLGHAAGDQLLVEFAKRLRASLRPTDTAARLGGDEFVICCEELGADLEAAQASAVQVVERILAALAEPIELDGNVKRMTASVGVGLVRGFERAPDTVLREADQAMYRAKQQGRARFELFDEALQARAATRARIAAELALAVTRGELLVEYQPVVSLSDGRIAGAEALVRWNHPVRGRLLPADFLDVAEESELMVSLGDWVIAQACRDVSDWRRGVRPDMIVMVNVSARQLGRRSLATSIQAALRRCGLPPQAMEIELTETMLISATQPLLEELEGLRDLGVQIGLDDFGTGHASLNYLRRLPLDFVKIDRSFVAGLARVEDDEAIVAAVVRLGHALGLRVIAEGVESAAQRRSLGRMACVYAQGWHVGRPRSAGDFARLLASEPSL